MLHLTTLGTLLIVHLAGLVAPGPNVLIVTQVSLRNGRKTGLLVAVGLAICAIFWSSVAMLGLDATASNFPRAHDVLRIVGSGYLIYIGVRMFRGTGASSQLETESAQGGWPAIRLGMLTSLSNPKAMLFFVGLFATILPPALPQSIRFASIGIIFLNSLVWHGVLAWFFSTSRARETYHRAGPWLDRFAGVLMIAIGAAIAFSLVPAVFTET